MLPKIFKMRKTNITFFKGIKNASFLGLGNIITQIVAVVGVIFIARLFGKENFGVYTTVMAFVTFFHLFILTGMSKAVIREGSKQIDLLNRVLEDTFGIRILFALFGLVLCIGAVFFTNYPDYLKVLIIIYSAEIFHYGVESILNSLYQTIEKMQYMAYFSVSTRILVTGASILALYVGAGVLSVLLINLAGRFLILFINFFNSRRFITFAFHFQFRFDNALLKAAFVFSLMKFINTFAVKIDILMVSFLSTSGDVGIYGVANEIAREGLILRNILAVAFFPIAVKYFRSNEVNKRTLLKYSLGLFLVVFAGCVLASFFVQDIVVLLFGHEFYLSGHILKTLIFFLPFSFGILPLTITLQATHNEKLLLVVHTVTALTNIPLNLILFKYFGLIGIAYSTIVVFFVQSLVVFYLTLKKMKTNRITTSDG